MMYKRQRKEVIDSYRGFQTMDSKDHPVVQHGIKAAELISDVRKRFDLSYNTPFKNFIFTMPRVSIFMI